MKMLSRKLVQVKENQKSSITKDTAVKTVSVKSENTPIIKREDYRAQADIIKEEILAAATKKYPQIKDNKELLTKAIWDEISLDKNDIGSAAAYIRSYFRHINEKDMDPKGLEYLFYLAGLQSEHVSFIEKILNSAVQSVFL